MDLLFSLIPGGQLTAILAAVGAVFAALWRAYAMGKKAERAKTSEERLKARDVADHVDNDIGALPSGAARDELKKWGRG
ncbi:hypothetical protein [Microcystis phage Mae-JY35]